MAAKTAWSVQEYLQTSFPGPDREYRDGELVERSMPDYQHGKPQALLSAFFVVRRNLALFPASELRLKLREGRFLIPDLSVFHPVEPDGGVPDTPPFITIEILSPDDRHSDVREKLEEYREWGVPHVWLVDPNARRMYTCDAGLVEVSTLKIPELGIEVTPADIFG